MSKPRLIIFASGTATGGGSGFENLVLAEKNGALDAEIVAVVSNYESGGVRQHATELGKRFICFPGPYTAEDYRRIVFKLNFDYIALSGWLKLVLGLEPAVTFNIHPGPLPQFGGPGMYGHRVHEAVSRAYRAGKITHSAVSIHFITDEYDRGPVFFEMPIDIIAQDTPGDVGKRVNEAEHRWQPFITDLVVHGQIAWDGVNPESLRVPEWYKFLPPETSSRLLKKVI